MNRIKLARILCAVWMWMIVACLPLSAQDGQRVFDDAGLFDTAGESALETQARELGASSGYDFVIVTTEDTGGKSTVAFADDFYDEGGFGFDADASGALLLVDMEHREIYISTTGAMIDILTDARIESLLDDVYNYVADQNYQDGAAAFLDGAADYIQSGVPNNQYRQDTETGEITPYKPSHPFRLNASDFLIALAIGLVAGGGTVWLIARSYRNGADAYQYPFRQKGAVAVRRGDERMVNRFVTTRHIPKPSSSSGSGGRSSTHRSSSGRSHGGGGRKF